MTPSEIHALQKATFNDGVRQGMHLFVQQFSEEFGCTPLEMAQACGVMITALREIDEHVALAERLEERVGWWPLRNALDSVAPYVGFPGRFEGEE